MLPVCSIAKPSSGLVNNKHPMVPLSTMEAGFRLMLHGLDAENLYGFVKFMRD
jgi:hypothetical protein